MKDIGIYIHIPFCKQKCFYCDFISFANKESFIEEYVQNIKKEINIKLKEDNYNIKTIYIGGGTPSLVDSKYIIEIINTIKENVKEYNPQETTIEVNPGTVTKEKLEDYITVGINRLSIGLQETDNKLLKEIGRIHTYEQFVETYKLARKVGFKNINVDLIIGLPDQKISNIKNSLNKIIELQPEHISVYSLILEENTLLYTKVNNNEAKLPNEDLERNMYWYVKNILEEKGYIHYEISNFAKLGYESKHNVSCWNQEEYLGFGLSAHSYLKGERFSNEMTDNSLKYSKVVHEIQDVENMQKEYMLLGLRKIQGVDIQKFKNKFGENPIFLFRQELNDLVEKDLIEIDGNYIKLTNKGLDLANIVWENFI